MASAQPVSRIEAPTGAIAIGLGVRWLPALSTFLGCPVGGPALYDSQREGQVVLAWGRRPSACKAEEFAARHRLPLWRLEDGFLRSIAPGNIDSPVDVALRAMGMNRGDAPLSLVVDDVGIHYDAMAPSRLENLINGEIDSAQASRARLLMQSWCEARISKYNHARDFTGELPKRYVLVADQTWGDPAIKHGMAEAASFQRMLEAARRENPDATVILKVHPQVHAGRRKGHFDLVSVARLPGVVVLGEDVHPASLIERAEAVYAVTSLIGFEGLLWNKPVRLFGMPFYGGWGLTVDYLPTPARRGSRSLENVVHAALVEYPRYLDPETGQRCEVERLVEWTGLQRRMRERFPRTVCAASFSAWKKPIVRAYLAGSRVEFLDRVDEVTPGSTLAVWGRKPLLGQMREGVNTIRLEDGFLRSVGLGADLVWPLSWVMDRKGIYYDVTTQSDLEQLLQTTEFSDQLRERARLLRERIVAEGLTKYNVGSRSWSRPKAAARVILVPGQVESDASIRLGAPGIQRNLELLRTVREENPGAYVLYKPHPDVLAGLRNSGASEDEAKQWCDQQITEANMSDLLGQVDEVHTLTSLAGFEALLRNKKVVCYGQPFYAGWGLTTDRISIARRTRRLLLDELIAAALILYPTYLSQTTGRFTTPERTLDELLAWRQKGATTLPLWRKGLRSILRLRAN